MVDDLNLTPIQQFYSGANIFITGGTGFLGQILIEKLLRSCPTISTIYMLIRSKKGKDVHSRADEIFEDGLFDRLRKISPKFRHKIVAVAGDCSLPNLGLDLNDRKILIDKVFILNWNCIVTYWSCLLCILLWKVCDNEIIRINLIIKLKNLDMKLRYKFHN